MRRPPALPNQPGPPFNAPAARRLRSALGMGPEHVAHDLRASYGMPHATPDLVRAWEQGAVVPTSPELTALAGVLWCSPGDLIGRPRTLREHRIARGVAPEDVALTVGLELLPYLEMEEAGDWRGTERQSAVLADLLQLSLPDFVTVTGKEEKLADLLRGAVTTRWQAYVRQVGKLVPLDRHLIENTLRGLHEDYQGRMTATLSWADSPASAQAQQLGEDFLARIVTHFWTAMENGDF
ncbi:helix-turn-helix transcriptional regulator [Streptomyces sp. NPDC007851]|uniref:helix-turn-helix domain-containing protein n=1 Tax=Streptomyces sp. NPDC007851 TaxID=3155008 RepID=UPI0033D8B52C